MTPRRHYAHAPITEAVIDIQVELPPTVGISDLERLHASIAADYPGKRANIEVEGQFTAGAQVGATAHQSVRGFQFASSDRKQVVQVRRDGFTFSRLSPYETWEHLRDEAKRVWMIYRDLVSPGVVNRVAVRYINQINIPLPMNDFKDYLRTIPEVSPDLNQELSNFFLRLEQPQKDIGGHLVLTEAMLPPMGPDVCPVVLDIDVFRQDLAISGDNEIWDILELLRDKKNEVFEGCITDATRRLIS